MNLDVLTRGNHEFATRESRRNHVRIMCWFSHLKPKIFVPLAVSTRYLYNIIYTWPCHIHILTLDTNFQRWARCNQSLKITDPHNTRCLDTNIQLYFIYTSTQHRHSIYGIKTVPCRKNLLLYSRCTQRRSIAMHWPTWGYPFKRTAHPTGWVAPPGDNVVIAT